MPVYRTLENIPFAQLHSAFLEGFSDYSVPMNLSEERFQGMLVRNGYVAEISMGAFEDDCLIGFVLNGLRNWDGVLTAYDSGTAVIPSWRRQGVSRALFAALFDLLRDRDIKRYLLEVITTNEAVVQLYRRLGFETRREFIVMSGVRPSETPKTSTVSTVQEPIATLLQEALHELWQVTPSWQNSLDAIKVQSGNCMAITMRQDNRLIGYGMFSPRSGAIQHLAVHPAYQRRGIGSTLLTAIAAQCSSEQLSMTNIDSRATNLVAFLEQNGFSEQVRQFEMVKELE